MDTAEWIAFNALKTQARSLADMQKIFFFLKNPVNSWCIDPKCPTKLKSSCWKCFHKSVAHSANREGSQQAQWSEGERSRSPTVDNPDGLNGGSAISVQVRSCHSAVWIRIKEKQATCREGCKIWEFSKLETYLERNEHTIWYKRGFIYSNGQDWL